MPYNHGMSEKPPIPEELTREQLWDMVLQLQERVAELEAHLSKPKKTSRNSSVPSSQTNKEKRDNRRARRGGKPGHEGKSRRNGEPDEVMECRVSTCPDCGTDVSDQAQTVCSRYQVVEIPPVQAQIIEVRRYETLCTCGCHVMGVAPPGYDDPHQGFGPNVHALLSYFNGSHHLSHQRLQEMVKQVFGFAISAGAIARSLQRTAQKLAQPAANILQDIRQSKVIGSDETGLRVEGRNWWLWVLQTPQASYFAAVNSRAGQVLRDLMCEAVAEVWCCDLGSAQLTAPTQAFAICNAHYLRKLQYAIDAGDTTFAPAFQWLLREALQLSRARDDLPPDFYQYQVDVVKATAQHLLTWKTVNEEGRKLKKSFTKHFDKMWLFLARADAPFDNNASERALRPAVIHRRVIGGFRTPQGAEDYATYRTIEDTARKRQHPVLQALYDVLGTPVIPATP
jgi:transposase